MTLRERLINVLTAPHAMGNAWMKRSFIYRHMSDERAIRLRYRYYTGESLNLDNPVSFNEKMQWLKLHDRRHIYTTMADKYEAKRFAAPIIGEQYIVPNYGVWEDAKDIDWDSLPKQVVLKTNHGYGGLTGMVICKDISNLDKKEAIKRLNAALKRNYFYTGREWPYKNIKPLILAEKYIGENLMDFRVYCFNGEPKLIYAYQNVAQEDGTKPELSSCDIFDCNWNPMPFHQKAMPCGNVARPLHLNEMLEISAKLSKDVPFLRVDFYEGEQLYLGELTFYPGGGMSSYCPSEWNDILGSWITLPEKTE